ncbi:extracellular solute-binding protein [Agathobaculum desmolans]|uniref:extracellular solute-binding protein n=1 Tax=Agathobaculum desmolans TaxID=39484 RepID=UPI00248E4A72|nr:extracellular solute-binding protein [Agathobaculum desmolans]
MHKRIFAVVLSLVLLILSSCAAQKPQDDNRQVLRVVLWDYDVTTYDRDIIQAFERENPDIRVDVTSYRSEIYTSSVQTMLESGAQVDVVYVNQMAMLTELMEKGFSLPLDDLIQQDGIDLSNFLYPDALRNADGALMALPYRTDRFVLYYNRDMFDAAGIAYPDADMTWDALVDTALQLQRHLDKTSGQAERYSVFSIYIPTHWSEYLTSAPFSVDTMDLSQLRQGMQMLIALQQQGAMVPISEIRAQRGVQRLFENGNYGMYLSGTWLMHYLKLDQEAGSCTMYWGVTDRPHWAQMENVDAAWISALSINQNSQRVEAAWRFVQFVCGKAGAEIMVDHLMLPGYWDQEISAQMAAQQAKYGIDTALNRESFAPPQSVVSAAESDARDAALETIGETVLGLYSLEEGMQQIAEIQNMYRASVKNIVE